MKLVSEIARAGVQGLALGRKGLLAADGQQVAFFAKNVHGVTAKEVSWQRNIRDTRYLRLQGHLAVACNRTKMKIWDASTGNEVRQLVVNHQEIEVDHTLPLPKDSLQVIDIIRLAQGVFDPHVRADFTKNICAQEVFKFSFGSHARLLDGKGVTLLGASANQAVFWNLTDQPISVTSPHSAPITAGVVLNEMGYALTACRNGELFLWDLESCQPVDAGSVDGAVYAIASKDGNVVLSTFSHIFSMQLVDQSTHASESNDDKSRLPELQESAG